MDDMRNRPGKAHLDGKLKFRDFVKLSHDFDFEGTNDLLFDVIEYLEIVKPELKGYLDFEVRKAIAGFMVDHDIELKGVALRVTYPRRGRREYWHLEPKVAK